LSLQFKHYLCLLRQSLTFTSGAIDTTVKRMLAVGITTVALWPTPTAVEPPLPAPPPEEHAVDGISSLTDEQEAIAREIERVLKDEGFENPEIQAAIINGLAESRLDPLAVGDHGNSRGVFQLNKNGLGHKMKTERMHDVETATRRVAKAMRRSKQMMKKIDEGATVEELTATFCIHIMRPSDKMKKAKRRASTAKRLVQTT